METGTYDDGYWRASRRGRFYEAGPDGRVRFDVLADWQQDVGADHAAHFGLAIDELMAKGLAWVLRRLTWNIHQLPAMNTDVAIETWPAGRDRMFFHRDFRLTNDSGALLMAANARWGLFDLETRRAAGIPDWIAEKVAVVDDRAADFPTGPVPALGTGNGDVEERPVIPRWSDLDLNGHVNNARLVSWLFEGLPRPVVADGALTNLDMAFRFECKLDDPVVSRAVALGSGRYRHALVNAETGKDIARAETSWA